MTKLKLGILISGRGSNMATLAAAASLPDFPAEIVQIVSNVADAPGVEWALEIGLPVAIIESCNYDNRAEHEAAVSECLKAAKVDLVCLAGYMRILENGFLRDWRGKLINIHPSLLPAFRGTNTHERALHSGCRIHGCTVHYVTAELDGGPIIAQTAVQIAPGDDAASLGERVLKAEHALYPDCVRLIAEGKIRYASDDGVRDVDVTIDEVARFQIEGQTLED